jgi:hypothetical protein
MQEAQREPVPRADTGELDTALAFQQHCVLKKVVAHMAAETARHAGHADVLREQIDGATGR